MPHTVMCEPNLESPVVEIARIPMQNFRPKIKNQKKDAAYLAKLEVSISKTRQEIHSQKTPTCASVGGLSSKMVQRKVTNKPGIQADDVKSDKLLVSHESSSFSQHQDGMNKGADMKKKMKKSTSISNLRMQALQLGKPPPPLDVPTIAATPQKQSPTKALDASLNYLKSTSSSDAIKQQFQVCSWNSQTGSNCKSLSRKNSSNSKLSSGSSQKPSRTLARTTNSELVRTLTRTPSLKTARASPKRCSPVVHESLDVQRATCSSTLKGLKFPDYLALNPGGSESDGTSVFKVCRYTYCSLRGHHHTPLPSLKCLMSASRRMLKTNKITNLRCLSPHRATALRDSTNENDSGQVIFDKRTALQEMDTNGSVIPPLVQGEHTDFFIEIYTKDKGNIVQEIDGSKREMDDQAITDYSVNDIAPSVDGNIEAATEDNDDKLVKSLSRKSLCSNLDFEEFLSQNRSAISRDMETTKSIPSEDPNAETADVVLPPPTDQEESATKGLSTQHRLKVGGSPRTQADEPDSEASDMDWGAEPCSSTYLDDQSNGSHLEKGDVKEIDNCNFHEPISESDDTISGWIDIQGDNMINKLFDEASVISEAWHGDSDTQSDGSYQDSERTKAIQGFDNQGHLQFLPTHNAFEEPSSTEQSDEDTESDECLNSVITLIPLEDPHNESRAATKDTSIVSEEGNEVRGDSSTEEKALKDNEENESPRDANKTNMLLNQGPDSSCNFTEKNQNETYDHSRNHSSIEAFQFDDALDRDISEEVLDGSLLSEGRNFMADQICIELEQATATDAMDSTKMDDPATLFEGSQSLQFLQGFSEIDQQESSEDYKNHQLGGPTKESEPSKPSADEGLPAERQDDEQAHSDNVIEDHKSSKIDRDESKGINTSNNMDPEDENYSEIIGHRSAEIGDQCVDELEMEQKSTFHAEETCLTSEIATNLTTKYTSFPAEGNLSKELSKACQNQQWARRCTRPAEESEELKNLNPREPNYLPLEPDPEAENVNLRHQMMDNRKNAEEWMLDYALQQAVTKLEPDCSKKVALLVEAFETVMPTQED